MSAKNFYQTLYQTDQIFRVAGESWHPATGQPADGEQPAGGVSGGVDLLSELDALATDAETSLVETLLVDAEPAVPLVVPEPQPVALPIEPQALAVVPKPEPLPQPAPRPTTPSILPPVQNQPRMPQLNHKVLLLADEELDPSNLLFLEKILKAVNLNVDGVDLLNLHGARDMDFAELLRGKYINHFITFGVAFERINLDIMMDRYSPVRFEGITFLMADSLPTIEADQKLKKQLWASLQRVFLQR